MKKRELKDIRNQSVTELRKKISDLKSKALTNTTNMWAGKEVDLKALRAAKRDIAQISTIIAEHGKTEVVSEEPKKSSKKGAEK